MSEYLLEIKNLKKSFPLKTGKSSLFGKTSRMCAVDNMSLSIKRVRPTDWLGSPDVENLPQDVQL